MYIYMMYVMRSRTFVMTYIIPLGFIKVWSHSNRQIIGQWKNYTLEFFLKYFLWNKFALFICCVNITTWLLWLISRSRSGTWPYFQVSDPRGRVQSANYMQLASNDSNEFIASCCLLAALDWMESFSYYNVKAFDIQSSYLWSAVQHVCM